MKTYNAYNAQGQAVRVTVPENEKAQDSKRERCLWCNVERARLSRWGFCGKCAKNSADLSSALVCLERGTVKVGAFEVHGFDVVRDGTDAAIVRSFVWNRGTYNAWKSSVAQIATFATPDGEAFGLRLAHEYASLLNHMVEARSSHPAIMGGMSTSHQIGTFPCVVRFE